MCLANFLWAALLSWTYVASQWFVCCTLTQPWQTTSHECLIQVNFVCLALLTLAIFTKHLYRNVYISDHLSLIPNEQGRGHCGKRNIPQTT